MIKLMLRLRPIDWFFVVILLAFVVVQVYFDVTIPEWSQKILDNQNPPTVDQAWEYGWIMVGLAAGSLASTIIASFFAAIIATQFSKRLRADIFSQVQKFGFAEINKFSTPSLITRTTNDVSQVQMAFIMILRLGVSAPLQIIWATTKISDIHGGMLLSAGAWFLLFIAGMVTIIILFIPRFIKIQKTTDKLNGIARENLTGLRVVKAYNAAKYQENKFNAIASEMQGLDRFVGRVSSSIWPYITLMMNGMTLTIYWMGANLVGDGKIGPSSIVATVALCMQVFFSFMGVIFLFVMIPRAVVSSKRINDILNTIPAVTDPQTPSEFARSGDIEFRNVSFKYPGAQEYVLQDINFEVKKGQTVAFIGSTGSGKSTVINLVPRFYDATEGQVLVGGIDIRQVKQDDLLATIGYVPQKGLLFSGSVNDNIGYGMPTDLHSERSQQDIKRAANIAQANDFVSKMENGYDSHIAQGGKNVSGGQKQRLSIARAVAIDPAIFIFDDSFSALDFKTDKLVREELRQNVGDATKLIVAQRVGSIMDADLIVVLEQGKVAGKGTHEELIKSCEVYKEIALSQLTAEELGI